ncbi:MAG: hypothetical protein OSJ73_04485 [Lachnospiraceae bacterium]|nr:hypothetical protein [Lachnospiraceae bacterium]
MDEKRNYTAKAARVLRTSRKRNLPYSILVKKGLKIMIIANP